MEFFRKTNFDFMARRTVAISASVILILIGFISLFIKGGPAYNIDFLGGTELEIRFQQPKATEDLRNVLAAINLGGAEIKAFGNPRDFVVRFQEIENSAAISNSVISAMQQAYPDDTPELLAKSTIGPKIGRELRQSALWALLVSMAMILIYISVRFEFVFAVGAVIALFHDVLITLGFFSVFNREISLAVIGGFLTLAGYSLNDTIVVFDRIRENLKLRRREILTIEQTINLSVNDTLSRTLLTGTTTMMVVIICLFFGGEVLFDFFLCLFVGILVGTYSSIFIAAPVVAKWYKVRHKAKPYVKA